MNTTYKYKENRHKILCELSNFTVENHTHEDLKQAMFDVLYDEYNKLSNQALESFILKMRSTSLED